jgi:hypothetical protein
MVAKTLAIITTSGGSKRIRRKNIKPFLNHKDGFGFEPEVAAKISINYPRGEFSSR